MGKDKDNLCKQSLIEGQQTCNNEDLLTECMDMCKKLGVKCFSQGELIKRDFRKAVWRENNNDIRKKLEGKKKVNNIINTKIQETEKLLENNKPSKCTDLVKSKCFM